MSDTITQEYIDGIKKGWIYTGDQLKKSLLTNKKKIIFKTLRETFRFLKNLREDLLITKGLWQRNLKQTSDIVEDIRIIVRMLSSTYEGIESIGRYIDEVGLNKQRISDIKQNFFLWNNNLETLFKYLEKILNEHGDDWPDGVQKLRFTDWYAGTPESRSMVPNEVSIGRARLVFQDTPMDPMYFVKGSGQRGPENREYYLKAMDTAYQLLKKKGLAKQIWYGKFFVNPGGSQTLAVYKRKGDVIDIRINPNEDTLWQIVGTIVHELGHRYWFKFLSKREQNDFRRYFLKTLPTSAYGSTRPREDFAELFAAYVLGNKWKQAGIANHQSNHVDFTKAQHQRMKAFLGRDTRLEDRTSTGLFKALNERKKDEG